MRPENVTLLAENAELRREIAQVEEKIPRYVPHDGPLPRTLEEYRSLPEPWRAQIARENLGHVQDLINRQVIRQRLAEHDRREARRLDALEDVPFTNVEEFNALSEAERQAWAEKLTDDQRRALVGQVPEPEGNYL